MKPETRRRWLGRLVFVAALAATYLGVSAWHTRDAAEGPAPALAGRTLDGQSFRLAAARGEPVLVHFWATWCPICRMEQSTIDALAEDYRVITVAAWSGDAAEVGRYVAENGITALVIADDAGFLAQRFGVRAVPASFVIDGNGDIRFVTSGYTTGPGLRLRLWWAGAGS